MIAARRRHVRIGPFVADLLHAGLMPRSVTLGEHGRISRSARND
jgi:hypothetical protein